MYTRRKLPHAIYGNNNNNNIYSAPRKFGKRFMNTMFKLWSFLNPVRPVTYTLPFYHITTIYNVYYKHLKRWWCAPPRPVVKSVSADNELRALQRNKIAAATPSRGGEKKKLPINNNTVRAAATTVGFFFKFFLVLVVILSYRKSPPGPCH